MDRSRTREELERLAELYLTDISARESTDESQVESDGVGAVDGVRGIDGSDGEVGYGLSDTASSKMNQCGVNPVRLAPHLRNEVKTEVEAGSAPEINIPEPPTLRYPVKKRKVTTSSEGVETGESSGRLIQAILPSHLPGIASPWLGQYANRLAKEYGCVVVVRVDQCTIEIDTYTYADGDDPEPEHFRFPTGHEMSADDKVTNHDDQPLLRVLYRLSRIAGAWLVHLPDPLNRFESTVAQDLTQWCLLSGADDPALLNTYRMIKTMLTRLPQEGETARRLEFVAMGTDEEPGQAAALKLDQALEAFLNVHVSFGGAIRRMKPVRRETVGHYSPNGHPWVVLREFFSDIAPEMLVDEGAMSREPVKETSIHLAAGLDEALDGGEALEKGGEGVPELKLKPAPAEASSFSEGEGQQMKPVSKEENPIGDIDLNAVFDKPVRRDEGDKLQDKPVRKSPPRTHVPLRGHPFDDDKPEDPDQPLHRFPTPLTEAEVNALMTNTGLDEAVGATQAELDQPTDIVGADHVEVGVGDDSAVGIDQAETQNHSIAEPEVVVEASVDELKQCALQLASTHLSQFLTELTPLVARCPRHRQIEIAIDSVGRLHLLMYTEGISSNEAIRRLMQTYHWAMEHAELLGLTLKDQRLNMDMQPVLHLFTNEPKYAADFVFSSPEEQRQMQLHLLQPVIMNQQATCVHARIS